MIMDKLVMSVSVVRIQSEFLPDAKDIPWYGEDTKPPFRLRTLGGNGRARPLPIGNSDNTFGKL
jgi:hypothetical protein